MKKYFSIAVIGVITGIGGIVMLQTGFAAPTENQVKLYMNPSSVSVKQGSTFSEQIRLSKVGTEKIDYVSAQVTYPANLLEIKSATRTGSSFNKGGSLKISYNNAQGTFSAAGSSDTLSSPENVLVVTVVFSAKAPGAAKIRFATSSQAGALLGNNSVKNALDTMVGSNATITSTTVAAEQSADTTTASGSTSTEPAPDKTTPNAEPDTTSPVQAQTTPADDEATVEVAPSTATESRSDTHKAAAGVNPWVIGGIVAVLAIGATAGATWLLLSRRKPPIATQEPEEPVFTTTEPESPPEDDAPLPPPEEPRPTAELAVPVQPPMPPEMPAQPVAVPPPQQPALPPQPVAPSAPPMTQPATPQQQSVQAPVTPAVRPAAITPTPRPVADQPKTPAITQAPPAQTTASTTNSSDDNIPDMFELGKQRLEQEGLRWSQQQNKQTPQ